MPQPMTTGLGGSSRVAAGVRALAAAAVLVVVIAGVPPFVAATLGSPVPGLRDLVAGDVSDQAVIVVLACVLLLAWGSSAWPP